jgi:hypothetical protein
MYLYFVYQEFYNIKLKNNQYCVCKLDTQSDAFDKYIHAVQ